MIILEPNISGYYGFKLSTEVQWCTYEAKDDIKLGDKLIISILKCVVWNKSIQREVTKKNWQHHAYTTMNMAQASYVMHFT